MTPPPRAIVTRPAHEAAAWAARLGELGIAAQPLPLIAIEPLREPALRQALAQARADAARGRFRAVMFVSPSAVRHFFDGFEPNVPNAGAQQGLSAINFEAWAPGPGTAQALGAAGVAADGIVAPAPASAQFDSESLWQAVATRVHAGERVLIVRGAGPGAGDGGSGRQWLAERLAASGVAVDFVAAYVRRAPPLQADALALARAGAHDGSVWLLSSSEALEHLAVALPGQRWQAACALATHPRIAQAARSAGFGRVHECRPTLGDVAASIKSFHVR